mmetsp:Transcript_17959/g.36167  ORF Transcript_17959/g.36167 Transcript_17959/m.36167 type:complete len:185 (-) Transcript_17959:75-629(-)
MTAEEAVKAAEEEAGRRRRREELQDQREEEARRRAEEEEERRKLLRQEEERNERVLALCLLQRADGAFPLTPSLAAALSLPLSLLQAFHAALPSLVDSACGEEGAVMGVEGATLETVKQVLCEYVGTVAAVAGMRLYFASERAAWELQESKAARLLSGKGVPSSLIEVCIAAIQATMPAAVPAG